MGIFGRSPVLAGPPQLPSSLLPAVLRCWLSSLPLILLSSPEPKPPHGLPAGQEPHPSPGSCACRSGTQFSPSCRPTASHCCWVRTFTRPYSLPSLCLSSHSALSSGCLPSPVLCLSRSAPSTLRMAFLAGEPPPRPPQPAIFAQSKWGCSRCLGPCPRPLSPLIPPLLLEGTEPWWAGWLCGRGRGVCAVSFYC